MEEGNDESIRLFEDASEHIEVSKHRVHVVVQLKGAEKVHDVQRSSQSGLSTVTSGDQNRSAK